MDAGACGKVGKTHGAGTRAHAAHPRQLQAPQRWRGSAAQTHTGGRQTEAGGSSGAPSLLQHAAAPCYLLLTVRSSCHMSPSRARNPSDFTGDNGGAPCMANLRKLHTHTHTQNVSLFVPGCENTCSWPPTHSNTLHRKRQHRHFPWL